MKCARPGLQVQKSRLLFQISPNHILLIINKVRKLVIRMGYVLGQGRRIGGFAAGCVKVWLPNYNQSGMRYQYETGCVGRSY